MKLLNTGITDLLIVPIEEEKAGWYEVRIGQGIAPDVLVYNHGSLKFGREVVQLPKGYKYTVLGRAKELTEEQVREVIPPKDNFGYLDYCFRGVRFATSLTESFHSLLKANGILLENPLGEKPYETFNHPDWEYKRAKWEEAQSKVSNPLILKAEPLTKDIDPEIQKVIDDKFWDMI